ncbi:transglutaminase domain-containing protein [Cyanobacterium aponinum]|uniref:Transglutaminase n=1 Tax=Cyanobacterium aponinum 0216 TaxID=2676140 RepID=A0A844GVD4_9CHRO|nr:transglutaminase domain-containing protein [Cyanobacterium aponinum]MTF38175.1 transglutaminase [Cyanobacterium aponinum 0216]
MTTEREYREWHKQRNKQVKRRQRKKSNFGFFVFLIIAISLGVTIKSNPQIIDYLQNQLESPNLSSFFNAFRFRVNSLKSLTEEFITEIDEPVVITENYQLLEKRNFSDIDRKAKSIKYTGNSVEELSQIFSRYAKTEADKARIIYTWITYNISYDVGALNDLFNNNIYPDVRTEIVLNTRSTICSGYANLYQQLAKKMGLKSVIVLGYAKGENYIVGLDNNVNHAWNAVKIDSNWYLIDTTWGAGTVTNNGFNAQFNPFYFATNPREFIYTHFPENDKWQLLNPIMSRSEFDSLANVSPTLFEYDIQLLSHPNVNISTDENNINIALKVPKNVVAIASLKFEEKQLQDNYTFVQKQGENILINASFPEKGEYKLDIFAKPKDETNSYPLVVSYNILASGNGNQFPKTFQHFNEYNGYLETPLNNSLNPNQNTYFKLKIDQALEVKAVNKSTNQWHDLERYGNVFAGNINVGNGDIILYAKFPQDSRYWALLEYGNNSL